MEGDSKCALCGDAEHIVRHHLSYDPEIVVPLCKWCHVIAHRYSKIGTDGRALLNKWVLEFGHLWVRGAYQYHKSPWYKKKKKQYFKKDYKKHTSAYKKRAKDWDASHRSVVNKRKREYYKKIVSDPLSRRRLFDRKNKERREAYKINKANNSRQYRKLIENSRSNYKRIISDPVEHRRVLDKKNAAQRKRRNAIAR